MRARPVTLPAIGLLALTLRLLYLWHIQTIPFFEHPVGDAASYTSWAKQIAAGDWIGNEVFYQAPAYPYFLAVVHLLVGSDPWAIRIVQSILGALACIAVAVSGSWFFGRGAGITAAVMLALYPPAIFFDGLVQKASLSLTLMTLLLVLLAWIVRGSPKARDRSTGLSPAVRCAKNGAPGMPSDRLRPTGPAALMLWHWLGVGVVLALLALTRENALLFLPPILLWLWVHYRSERVALRLVRSAAFIAGMTMVLLPVALRNYVVGGEFVVTTVQAAPNFYIGNSRIATGRYVALRRGHESPPFERADAETLAAQALGRPLNPGEVSRYWWSRSFDFIRKYPGRWVALMGKKWLLVWNAYEIPDTQSYSLYGAWSPLLGAVGCVFHFGVLCPLAVMGIVLTWPRRRELWLLYLLIVTVAVGVAAFYVVARYRYPLVPLLVLFAGAGVARAYAAMKADQRKSIALPLAAGFVVAIVANLRINPERQLNAMAYANLGAVLAQQGKLDAAIRFFETALEGVPASAEVHFNLGIAHACRQRFEEAGRHYRRALQIEPGLIHANYNLGVALEALGRVDAAIEQYRLALSADPNDEDARNALRRLGAAVPSCN